MNGVKISGLWKNTGKDGKPYLSGTIGVVKILVFPNELKKEAAAPDFYLFVTAKEEKGHERKGAEAKAEDLFI